LKELIRLTFSLERRSEDYKPDLTILQMQAELFKNRFTDL